MTLNYIYPGSGVTPATGAQASQSPRQIVQVALLTTDTTFSLTHNWNLDTAALARLCPQAFITGENPFAGAVNIASRSTNAMVFDCAVTTAGTVEIVLDQPHSIIMTND